MQFRQPGADCFGAVVSCWLKRDRLKMQQLPQSKCPLVPAKAGTQFFGSGYRFRGYERRVPQRRRSKSYIVPCGMTEKPRCRTTLRTHNVLTNSTAPVMVSI